MVGLNAITFVTENMAASLAFYRTAGFGIAFGGPEADFTTLRLGGETFLNLTALEVRPGSGGSAVFWGRVIIHVESPDELHAAFASAGYQPHMAPSDAPWGERYFHITDPDGNEVSFARRL